MFRVGPGVDPGRTLKSRVRSGRLEGDPKISGRTRVSADHGSGRVELGWRKGHLVVKCVAEISSPLRLGVFRAVNFTSEDEYL